MRKAFDANVPKLKPRLKPVAPLATLALEERVDDAPPAVRAPVSGPPTLAAMARDAEARLAETSPLPPPAPVAVVEVAEGARIASQGFAPPADDLEARRERLDKIKRRVAEAARPRARAEPSPGDPSRAAERVLGLARDLEAELGNARQREAALQADLDTTRAELARAAGEGREALARAAAVEAELESRRVVLGDMLQEMTALEAERDEALRRAQAMAGIDEERARLLEEVSRRADQEAAGRSERAAEVERLTEELRDAGADAARLRGALAETARERDGLVAELESLRRDRAQQDAAKRALEQVHSALSQARARIG
jgi:chromosome segregation ATPase